MKELNLLEFAAKLAELPLLVLAEQHESLEEAARVVEAEAKAEIGEYQPAAGPFQAWQELAASTKADRVSGGFPENEPLLRTGALRDSIEHRASAAEAVIGSDNDIAVYQELGTRTIPPRSFLGGAAIRKTDEVVDLLGGNIVRVLAGEKGTRVKLPDV